MPDAPKTLEERIERLEARLAYQDETIETLNKAITEQWSVIGSLRRELAETAERLEDAVTGEAPVDRPPPHY